MAVLLLVEDHADTRMMYAEFLREMFEVSQAADGEEALTLMRSRTPALVITDLSLPQMDGFELVKRIRSDDALATIPVICLSGYSDDAHERRRSVHRRPLRPGEAVVSTPLAQTSSLVEGEDYGNRVSTRSLTCAIADSGCRARSAGLRSAVRRITGLE